MSGYSWAHLAHCACLLSWLAYSLLPSSTPSTSPLTLSPVLTGILTALR